MFYADGLDGTKSHEAPHADRYTLLCEDALNLDPSD